MKTYKLQIKIKEGDTELEKNISLQANNPSELSQKINSLKVLSESIQHEDLISTVELIHEKPKLIPVVKNMIEEGDKLSETQMMLRLPKYVKQVLRVLKN
jgi:alkyl hydroperoxide reductase subunit AhpF